MNPLAAERYSTVQVLTEKQAAELPENTKLIGTHSQAFHCDDALACAMLQWHPDFKDVAIVRSRDIAVLDKCAIVVDVGQEHDPARLRFDHHMKDFFDCFDEDSDEICLSSAGLVYKHLGKAVVKTILEASSTPDKPVDDSIVDMIHKKVYSSFVKEVDALDNGIQMYSPENPEIPKYHIKTGLGRRVACLNPAWNEENTPEIYCNNFAKAVAMTGNEFVDEVQGLYLRWWPGRSIVAEAMKQRKEHHSSGMVLVIPQFCFYKEHIAEMESEAAGSDDPIHIVYVIAPHSGGQEWRVQCINEEDSMFNSRLPLPETWRGKDFDELSKASGIDGGVFVHRAGFIGGNKSFEGTLAMAAKSLEESKDTYVPRMRQDKATRKAEAKKNKALFLELVKRFKAEQEAEAKQA